MNGICKAALTCGSLVQTKRGKAMVSSLMIAELFDRRHDSVLRTIRNKGLRSNAETYVDDQGREYPVFWLAEREALILMPFLGGRRALEGQTKLVDAFLALHKAAERRTEPEWKAIRDKTKVGFEWMSDMLLEQRTAAGKETKPYHYMNEAKLINAALNDGRYEAVDREQLSEDWLGLVAELQRRNASLIAQGMSYANRKVELFAYVKGRLMLEHQAA